MRYIILSLVVLLTGCMSVPVDRKFPDVPVELQQACPDLKLIQPTTKLSDVIGTVSSNYSQYHECRVKVDAWIEWYKRFVLQDFSNILNNIQRVKIRNVGGKSSPNPRSPIN